MHLFLYDDGGALCSNGYPYDDGYDGCGLRLNGYHGDAGLYNLHSIRLCAVDVLLRLHHLQS